MLAGIRLTCGRDARRRVTCSYSCCAADARTGGSRRLRLEVRPAWRPRLPRTCGSSCTAAATSAACYFGLSSRPHSSLCSRKALRCTAILHANAQVYTTQEQSACGHNLENQAVAAILSRVARSGAAHCTFAWQASIMGMR